MTRRSFLTTVGALGAMLFLAGTVLHFLLGYEPGYYRTGGLPEGEERTRESKEFFREAMDVFNAVGKEKEWFARFTDRQANSWFREGLGQSGFATKLLPEGVSEPMVRFEPDRMRIAFRYHSGLVNTVVSLTLRIWLPRGESNVVALQLERFSAGLVPFSAQWMLERISDTARQSGVEVTWYRHEGHPVALLRFQADRQRPNFELKTVKFDDGYVYVEGQSNDPQFAELLRLSGAELVDRRR